MPSFTPGKSSAPTKAAISISCARADGSRIAIYVKNLSNSFTSSYG
jgi:hypothetical protein